MTSTSSQGSCRVLSQHCRCLAPHSLGCAHHTQVLHPVALRQATQQAPAGAGRPRGTHMGGQVMGSGGGSGKQPEGTHITCTICGVAGAPPYHLARQLGPRERVAAVILFHVIRTAADPIAVGPSRRDRRRHSRSRGTMRDARRAPGLSGKRSIEQTAPRAGCARACVEGRRA
eukprot:scaffold14712_cov124-Isochrysis_galbana.AAC.5